MAATARHDAPEGFSLSVTPRGVLLPVAGLVLLAVSAVLLAPAIADLPAAWRRLSHGDPAWLVLAGVLELGSFLGHILLFRAVSHGAGSQRIGLRASTEITFAGHAATRLLASGGAGGVALTAWAMRRAGMERAAVAARMTTFLVLLYSVYMAALVVGGVGLFLGLLHGGGAVSVTLVPAGFGLLVIVLGLLTQRVRAGDGAGRVRRLAAPVGEGVRDALRQARSADPGLLGALMWWAFDIATLWACFAAFGSPPPVGVIVMAYFVGTLANLLPLPGGVGGVEGGIIGVFVVFGTDPALALVAVLAYRVFAFWLPIAPGVLAFVSLKRTVARWALQDAGRVESEAWKVLAASSTTRTSSAAWRRWPSRCSPARTWPGPTTRSSSPST
jgi:uncharacterized membrane protein YbhN (UPF0104 family)